MEVHCGLPTGDKLESSQSDSGYLRDWRLESTRNNQTLESLAKLINPAAPGRMNYYGGIIARSVKWSVTMRRAAVSLASSCPFQELFLEIYRRLRGMEPTLF